MNGSMMARGFVVFVVIGMVMGTLQLLCVRQFHGPIDDLPTEVIISTFCLAALIIVAMMPLQRRLLHPQAWRRRLRSAIFPVFVGVSIFAGIGNGLGLVVRSWPVFWVDAAICMGLGIDAIFRAYCFKPRDN